MTEQHNKNMGTAMHWWQRMSLPPDQLRKLGISPVPSGYRAQLKRCESTDSVMMSEPFRALWLQLDDTTTAGPKAAQHMECWAVIGALLANVKDDASYDLPTQAGMKGKGDGPVVSEMRFAQMQQAKTPQELMRRVRRVLQQVKGTVSPHSLVRDLLQWFREYHSFRPLPVKERLAVRWAMRYYQSTAGKPIQYQNIK